MTFRRVFALLSLGATIGCATQNAAPLGQSAALQDRAVDIELVSVDGEPFFLGDYRGSDVVVFLFATFDGVSQISARPLSEFARSHPETVVIGIAIQPNAKSFAGPWRDVVDPDFVVAYPANETAALSGATDLGHVEAVPTVLHIDPHGKLRNRHVGLVEPASLKDFVK
ncbi:MAG: TlpA family protein disulfide reductase [Myxococcales bacterium]|nr:TlpA family protein disulfide reductase [Myxococcales bacterium]